MTAGQAQVVELDYTSLVGFAQRQLEPEAVGWGKARMGSGDTLSLGGWLPCSVNNRTVQ